MDDMSVKFCIMKVIFMEDIFISLKSIFFIHLHTHEDLPMCSPIKSIVISLFIGLKVTYNTNLAILK